MKQLKKYIITSFFFAFSFFCFSPNVQAADDLSTLTSHQQLVADDHFPATSLVIDAQHGQILWEDNADQTIDPGYLTHLMTLYVAYDALHKNEITWKSTIDATETHQTLSQIQHLPNNHIFAGATYSLEDLIKLVSFPTSTAASYLLAELVTGDYLSFVEKMNATAQQLGMKDTFFYSPSGLTTDSLQAYESLTSLIPENNNQSTPKDLALLAFHLVNQFPALTDITKQTDVVVQGSLVTQERFYNRNPFLFGQPNAIKGTNGLIMDFSNLQQTNAVFTVKQNDMMLISLLFGSNEAATLESTSSPMTIAGEALLTHTFDTYEYRVLASQGEQTMNRTTFYLEEDFGSVLPKNADATLEIKEGRLYLTNHLPLLSDSLPEVAVPYAKKASKIEEKVQNNDFLSFVIQAFEITKLTILAMGTILIGLLFFIMSFFIPYQTKKNQSDLTVNQEDNEDLETFETIPVISEHNASSIEETPDANQEESLEDSDISLLVTDEKENDTTLSNTDEVPTSRAQRHQQVESPVFKWPFRRMTFYGGILLMIIGISSLIVQYYM